MDFTAVSDSNGVANVELPKLDDGDYNYTITYSGDDKYSGFVNNDTMKVNNTSVKPDNNSSGNNSNQNTTVGPKINAANANVVYAAGKYYSVTVYGTDGKTAKNTKVTFKINGKTVKTVPTDSKGIAKFKITQKPGTYKVSATALGKTVTKTLKVKHLVNLKAEAVKKSAKKLVLQATLGKVNGKYLKNKKITFKFKGKTYKAMTNKKGVAKVTIKKSVLKKLKVGKKVTYQATYLKDTVKKTTKIKK